MLKLSFRIVQVVGKSTGWVKKNVSWGVVFFFNPKNATIGSGVDQNKKLPSFWPIGLKMLILHENLEFLMPGENFPLKKVNFWPMGQKDGDFLFLINARANGNIFRVKKSHICVFLNILYMYKFIYLTYKLANILP